MHSLFASTDDWDNQLEGTESGWPGFFRILRIYLTHFRGQRSAMMQWMAPAAGTEAEAWETLTAALGLKGVSAGQRWTAPAGVPALGGVVEHVSQSPCNALLRLDKPGPGVAALGAVNFGGSVMVTLSFYLYGDQAAGTVARETPLWQAWIQERFPMPRSRARANDRPRPGRMRSLGPTTPKRVITGTSESRVSMIPSAEGRAPTQPTKTDPYSDHRRPARLVLALPEGHRGLVVLDVAVFRVALERALGPVGDVAEVAEQRAPVPLLDLGVQAEVVAAADLRDEVGGVERVDRQPGAPALRRRPGDPRPACRRRCRPCSRRTGPARAPPCRRRTMTNAEESGACCSSALAR